jgi:hypothetical protein
MPDPSVEDPLEAKTKRPSSQRKIAWPQGKTSNIDKGKGKMIPPSPSHKGVDVEEGKKYNL